jgi:CO/xanthine dehydrogenase Mo-binding subunit
MKLRGIGIGSMMYGVGYGFSRPDIASAEVDMAADGTVTLWSGASELGQGIHTALLQIAAQELGVPYEDTRIISADTASTPDSGPVSASRSVYVQGRAVIQACADLKSQLTLTAAELLDTIPEMIGFASGLFFVDGDPSKSLPIARVAEECQKRGRRSRGLGWVNNTTSDVNPETSQGDAYSSYAWASQLVEVEVDTDTGLVKVLRIASATDTGKTINPTGSEGQIEGGAVMGMGFALMEKMVVEEGVFKNTNFTTYLIPTAADVPEIVDSLLVEVPDPTGPYGAKGIGEPATIPTTPAILNAIADATGKRVFMTPANPENILTLLGKIDSGGGKTHPLDDIPYPPI